MPMFGNIEQLRASRRREAQLTNRELQDEVAANCRLSRLPADIKIHILAFADISGIRTLLRYLPLSATSFQRLFDERKRAILAAIVQEKLSWEWSIIAGSDPYVPLASLKPRYFNQIALVVCAHFDHTRFGEMKPGTGFRWLPTGQDFPNTLQDLRMKIYKNATRNAFDLLELLEEVQKEMKAREKVTLEHWKKTSGDQRRESWIVSWGRNNLYRALLIEWKLQLPDISKPADVTHAPDTRGIKLNSPASQAVRSRLTYEEWTTLVDLMEARASHRSRKIETVKPEKPSAPREEMWGIFLAQLEEAQSNLISSLEKGISALPCFLDISPEERIYLDKKFP
ncbi:uncharacterized protein BDCG_03374 [Blastomyces dermatitidis ER-3]|nr:hypothetical protein, variant [Blastomyces dermatitidis ER-3]XP_045280417.1 uncharacterized protein BDCG_03374 [Blastomyces dermatitidis ER-3]EGE77587.1 hypothetical protein BDDG_00524 [Blastomyces dermatitidis ATCC 18188]EQL33676.1 hypothetical protein BDFG_04413 [Blastomyces dermatitidis ATCC 26199]EEQ88254.1 hypothetical protein, variant [Blastomyces dermatitidis ER-3]EQL33677.1 hypothetical protein, variant [Blastomyces dermatitidis ATCC 26199]OAT00690.1 hypothetical protein BDCG_03374